MMSTASSKSITINRKRRTGQARIAALSFSAAASLYAAFSGRALAATIDNPLVGVTGWNQDLIAETPNSSSTTIGFDTFNGQTFFVNGLIANGVNSAAYGTGVPANGSLVSATGVSTFQLQSYTANNALMISPTSDIYTAGEVASYGTLGLGTPASTSALSFLMASTNGTDTINYTLNYTDGTTATGTFSAPDWFNNTPIAAAGLGRTTARQVNSDGPVTIDTAQSNSSSGNPRMYEFDVPAATLSTNSSKFLSSVTFSSPTTNGNATAIYGISGATGATFTATPLLYTGNSASFDTSTVNFSNASGGATAFANGMGPVTFDDSVNASAAIVNDPANGPQINLNVQSAGVSPAGVVFNNSYGNTTSVYYKLTGGPIMGPGGLTITNSGTVEVTNTNTYVGTTNISNGGYLQIDAGASIASQNIIIGANSTLILQPNAQPTSAGVFGVSDNGTLQLNNITRTLGYLNGNGTLALAGAGSTVTIGGQLGYGSSFGGTITGAGNISFASPLSITGASSFVGTSTFGYASAVLLGTPSSLGVSTNTMVFAGYGASSTYYYGGIGATTSLTSTTGGAVPYNYSFAAGTTSLGYSGNFPLELSGNATNWNTSGITFNMVAIPTAPLTLDGQIGVGGGALTIIGGGTLILNNTAGTNALTGTLTVTTGAVQLNGAKETGTMAAYSIASGSSVVIADSSGFAGKVGGVAGGAIITATANGVGAPFAFPNAVTGQISSSKEYGAFRGADGQSDIWAGNVSIGASGTGISGGVGGTFTITGNITSSSTYQILFSGNNQSNTVLSGVNTFTGESAISGYQGVLTLGSNTAITSSADLNLDTSVNGSNGTTFNLAGYNAAFGYLTTTSAVATGDIITNTGSTPSQIKLTSTGGTFAGSIQETPTGQISVYFNGTGTQTFGPANNYSGGTTMNNSGTLLGGTSASFGSGTITMNNGYLGSNVSTGIVVSNQLVYGLTNGIGLNIANPITITSAINLPSGTITPFRTTGTDLTGSHGVFSGNITGSGAVNIAGTVVFSGTNSYSGGTNLSSGSLGITSDANVGTGPVKFLGGALSFVGYTSNLNFTNNGLIPPQLGAANNGTGSILNGVISTTTGNSSTGFLYIGPGTLVLNAVNTYTGTTNVSGGLLGFASPADLPLTPINLSGGGIQLPLNNPVDLTSGGRTISFSAAGGAVDTNGNNVTFAGPITNIGTGVFSKFGAGALTLSQPLKVTTLYLRTGTSASPSTLVLGSATPVITASTNVDIGETSGDVGLLSLNNGALLKVAGNINVADTVLAGSAAAYDVGTLNISDTNTLGTSVFATGVYVGQGTGGINAIGTINQTGGTFRINSSSGTFDVGVNGVGTYNLSGGTATAAVVTVAKTNTSNGTFNLLGGNLITTQIVAGVTSYNAGGGSFFNFGGGTLTANASSTTFFTGLTSATIGAAGAFINTNGFNDTITQNLSSGVVGAADGGITKLGAGVLTLSGNNSFTGPIIISGGSIVGTTATAFGSGGVFLNNALLTISADPTYPITFNGSSGLVFNNYSSTTFNVPNNYSNPSFTLGAIGTSSFAGNISGNTVININGGTGTLTITNANNNYSGGTTLISGTLLITADSVLGTGPVSFAGGALGFTGYTSSLTISNASGSSIAPTLAAATGTTSNFAGTINGTAGFKFVGPGTLTLTGTSNYTGTTNVSGGELGFQSPANLPIGQVILNGGGIQFNSGFTTDLTSGGRTLGLNASGGTLDSNGQNITFANSISGSGPLTKLGIGGLTLAGTETVTNLTVRGGLTGTPSTLSLVGSSNMSASGTVGIGEASGDNAVLSLNGALLTAGTLNVGDAVATGTGLAFNNGVFTTAGASNVSAATVNVGYANGGSNATGVINLGGGLFKSTGTTTVGVNGIGTFNNSGAVASLSTVTIGSGTTGVGVYNNLPGATSNFSSTVSVSTSGTGVFQMSGGTVNFSSTVYAGDGTGKGYFNQSGGTINQTGTFYVGASSGAALVNLTGGTFNTSGQYYQGSGLGGGVVNVAGGSFTSTYAGGFDYVGYNDGSVLNVSGGSFTLASPLQLNDLDSGIICGVNQTGGNFSSPAVYVGYEGSGNSVSTYNLSGGIATIQNVYIAYSNTAELGIFSLTGGTLITGGISTNGTSGYAAPNGAYLNISGGTIQANASSTSFISQVTAFTIGLGGAIINTNGFSDTITSNISTGVAGSADGGLIKNGLGVLTLSGTNSFTGPIVVNAGGLIGLGTQPFGFIGNGTPNSGNTVTINAGATIGLTSDTQLTSLQAAPDDYNIVLMPGAGYVLSNYNSTSLSLVTPLVLGATTGTPSSVSETITGSGALTYVGPGTLILSPASGSNSYTGGTNISSGILAISSDADVNNIAPTFVAGLLQINYSSGLVFSSGPVNLSVPTGATASLTNGLAGTAALNFGGPGTLVLSATGTNTSLTTLSGGTLNYSSGSLGTGNINLGGGTLVYAIGTTDDLTAGRVLTLAAGSSTINLNSQNVTFSGNISGANLGSLTVTGGGGLTLQGSLSPTSVSVAGGTASLPTVLTFASGSSFNGSSSAPLSVGVNSGDYGVLNISSGASVVMPVGSLKIATNSGSNGVVNLNGGTLQTAGVSGGSGTSTFNFNGGVLLANASTTAFVTGVTNVQIQAGPAYINTNGFNDTISSNISTGSTTPDGGVVKQGLGTLTISGTNSYSGGTTVNAGTVSVSNARSLGTGAVTVNSSGKLSISNPVGFNSSAVPISLVGGSLSLGGNSVSTGSGFSGFSPFNLSLPGSTGYTPTNTGTALNLTQSGVGNFAASTTLPFTVNDAGVFTMTFLYNHSTASGSSAVADGISFGFEKQSATAIGGQGGSEGFSSGTGGSPVTPGEVGYFDIYGENYGLGNNGVLTSTGTNTNISTYTGELVTLTYNGPAKTFTSSINTSGGTYTSTATNIDLVSQLGGTAGGSVSAWLYFAGSTGGVSATQNVSNLAYSTTLTGGSANISNPVILTAATTSNLQLGSVAGAAASAIGSLTFGAGSVLDITNTGTSSTYSVTIPAIVLAGPATLDMTSGGTAYLGALNDSTGTSTLTLQDTATFVLNSPATSFGSGSTLNVSTGTSLIVTAPAALGTGALNVFGTAAFAANNTSGGVYNYSSGPITVNSGGLLKLNVSSPQSTRILLTAAGLALNGTGSLNLGNNEMDIQGGNLATITGYAKAGYNGGNWNGSGISSSSAASNASHLTGVGVILNSPDGGVTQLYGANTSLGLFDGANPAATDVLVKYTYYGDTNLDGAIDGTDYSRIDATFASETSTASVSGWYNGDFNYDGVVNGSDYTLMDNAFNLQGVSLGTNPAAQVASQVSGGGSSAVPEPASVGLLTVAAAGVLGRRRRKV